MEKLLENSVLDELYQHRNEEVSHHFIKNSKEYKEHEKAMENRLMELLNYVPGEQYYQLKDDIEEFLFEHILCLSEFWCSKYYKVGFADGLNVKKELQKELEDLDYGQSVE